MAVEELLARELEPLSTKTAEAPDRAWRAEVESLSPPRVSRVQDLTVVEADLGVGDPIRCNVHDNQIDGASSVGIILKTLSQNVDVRGAETYHFEALGSQPALFLRIVYIVKAGGVEKAGEVKLMVAPRSRFSTICMLDVPGYTQTFARVASRFARSLAASAPEPKHKRVEVWKVSIGDTTIGYESWIVDAESKNRMQMINVTAMLLPTGPGQLKATDALSLTSVDARGHVLSGTWVSVDDGEIDYQIEAKKAGKGYTYHGSFKGKKLEGKLDVKDLYASTIPVVMTARRVAATRKPAELRLAEYHPGIDPTNPTGVRYELEPKGGGSRIRGRLGAMEIEFEADKQGTLRRWTMPIAGATLEAELVFEEGAL